MFSTVQRVQNVFGYYTTVILIVSAIISALSYTQLIQQGAFGIQTRVENLKLKNVVKFTRRAGSVNNKGKENVRMNFDLDADLTPLFNWNTKQVFVYLTAEYDGGAKRADISNKVTFWDKIILTKDDAVLRLRNQRSAYSVYDVQKSFNENNATLKLGWNIQPWVGALIFGESEVVGEPSLQFPGTGRK